ncbi:MAG: PTS sugar transporter subunit IIA [Lentisphaeria bacterium]|jgi:PTS system nitrogen regulatory IIA component
MILTLKELADYLRVNERTILRMLKSGQIQGVKIGGQWRFNGSQIDQLFFPQAPVSGPDVVPLSDFVPARQPVPVSRLVKEDRMILEMHSRDMEGVIPELCEPITKKTLLLDVQDLKARLLAREKLLSTGIGHGIAIPHPRDPIPTLREPAIIIVGRSAQGVEFQAVDNAPVHLFFLLVCQNIELHLHLMGALAHLLQDNEFVDACRRAPTAAEIIRLIMEQEAKQFLQGKGAEASKS